MTLKWWIDGFIQFVVFRLIYALVGVPPFWKGCVIGLLVAATRQSYRWSLE